MFKSNKLLISKFESVISVVTYNISLDIAFDVGLLFSNLMNGFDYQMNEQLAHHVIRDNIKKSIIK